MFKEMKRKETPQKVLTLAELRNGQLFVFHSEGDQTERVYIKTFVDNYSPPAQTSVVELISGQIFSVDSHSEVFPVEATMEWHLKPWSVQV